MKLKNSALQELYDTVVNYTITFPPYYGDSPIDRAFKECDEKLSDSIAFVHVKDLQDRNDILEGSNKALLEANLELASKKRQLEKEIEELKKQNEDLASQYQKLTIENKRLLDAKAALVKANDDRTNLQEACDKLSGENRRLNARIDCLRLGVKWYRKRYKEQSDKINELTKNYQDLSIKLKRYQIDVGRESRYLWDMLQEVSDYYYFGGDDEFDTDDCEMTSMTDIIDNLNVDQFLEAYKNWHKTQEQHRLDRMRDWLHGFCANRFCKGCPLASDEYKCGRGYSFSGAKPIPDEDIERYYEKARKTWTCTLEGTIEIDKDLLKKVCGIDSDD